MFEKTKVVRYRWAKIEQLINSEILGILENEILSFQNFRCFKILPRIYHRS